MISCKWCKLILSIAFIVLVLVCLIVWINRPIKTVHNIDPDYSLSAADFLQQFINDIETADKKFQNKVIEIQGIIEDFSTINGITTFEFTTDDPLNRINVQLNEDDSFNYNVGEIIKTKAFYVGVLDELGMDIELNRAIIIKN